MSIFNSVGNFFGTPRNTKKKSQPGHANFDIKQAMEYLPRFEVLKNDFSPIKKFTSTDKSNFLSHEVFNETLHFYNDNYRSNVLENMLKKVSSQILDNYDIIISGEERQDLNYEVVDANGNISSATLFLNEEFLTDLCISSLIYSNVYLKLNVDGELIRPEIIEPFMVSEGKDYYRELCYKGGLPCYIKYQGEKITEYIKDGDEFILNQKYTSPLRRESFFRFDLKETFTTKALIELVLQRSKVISFYHNELLTASQKIFASDEYFANGVYDDLQTIYRAINSPTLQADGSYPPFEVVQGDLRASGVKEMLDINTDLIATSLMLDKATLGIDSNNNTATEIKIKNATVVSTINSLKKEFKHAFNRLFRYGLGVDVEIHIERYQINDLDSRLQLATTAVSSGLMSVKNAIKFTNMDLTDEEILIETIISKFERGIRLTKEELDYARDNDLIPIEELESGYAIL